jgi:hypothetical protein
MQTPDTNWLLFQKRDAGALTAFAELLWLDGTLFSRKGKPSTFGESKREMYGDLETLDLLLAEKRMALEGDGFALTREWHFVPSAFDFALLQREVEDAGRAAFKAMRLQHQDSNAFAIVTDDSRMTIGPVVHSFPSIKSADRDQLWNPAEWANWKDAGEFDIAYRLILSQSRDDLSTFPFESFCDGFDEAVVTALEHLVREGTFSSGEPVVVIFSSTESEPKPAHCERLNPADVLARPKPRKKKRAKPAGRAKAARKPVKKKTPRRPTRRARRTRSSGR